jgi:epoxyqueuosine reductase
MTLPMALETDSPVTAADILGEVGGEGGRGNYQMEDHFPFCRACSRERPPCKRACPTGAIRGNGEVDLEYCIQWYASGNGTVIPPEVIRCWGRRLYGCTECQDACIRNRGLVRGVQTNEGPLPAYLNCRELLAASDEELKARFKGTAMGLSWLGPKGIRRNARLAWEKKDG